MRASQMSDERKRSNSRASNQGGPQRRQRGFEAVAGLAHAQTRPALNARGISEVKLVAQWREIVGDRVASACQPVRVKAQRGGVGVGGVLILSVSGPRASEIEHLGPRIVERVNGYYGYAAVSAVQLTQSSRPAPTLDRRRKPEPPPLSSGQRAELQALTDPIANDGLREALNRLGANVMRRPAKRAITDPREGGDQTGAPETRR